MCACVCCLPQVREVGSDASWQGTALSHWEVLERIIKEGKVLNPLLMVPWVKAAIFRIDWLHACDQGAAPDFLGNLFWQLQKLLPGNSIKARVSILNEKVLAFYEANNVQDRFDKILPEHFVQKGKGFKLRGSGAKVRALVPCGKMLADELCSDADPCQKTLRLAATHLFNVYQTLSSKSIFHEDIASSESTKFALLYVALHDELSPADDRQFRIKPKLHLFLHICSDGSKPSLYWNYRDEDWGGTVAHLSRRRGGLCSVSAVSSNCLLRFVENEPVIRIV